jgi:hypothetical protein
MDDKENKEGFDQDWKANQAEGDSDDYGLPHIAYDPLEKEDDDYQGFMDNTGHESERYYDYEKRRGSPVLVVFLILFILGGIVFGVYWFQFRNTGSGTVVAPETYQLPTPVRPEIIEEPVIYEQFSVPEPVQSTGEFQVVSSPSSSYYIVVGSFIDDDLAMDHSKLLNSQGINTYLIEPINNNKFYRLAIGNFGTWGEAVENLDELKFNFGQDIWVLKF